MQKNIKRGNTFLMMILVAAAFVAFWVLPSHNPGVHSCHDCPICQSSPCSLGLHVLTVRKACDDFLPFVHEHRESCAQFTWPQVKWGAGFKSRSGPSPELQPPDCGVCVCVTCPVLCVGFVFHSLHCKHFSVLGNSWAASYCHPILS